MKYLLLTTEELQDIIEHGDSWPDHKVVSLALEILEYRRVYGPLGCQWLANPHEPAEKR